MSSFFRSVSDSDDSSSDEEEVLSDSDSGNDSGLDGKVNKAKGNKFLKKTGSDDDSDDSDDDSDDDDSDASELKKPADAAKGNRFLRDAASDDSDSDDERAKVVKSAKSKRLEEVDNTVKGIENAAKINDWVHISDDYDKLLRLISRQANVAEPLPTAFVKILVDLETMLASAQSGSAKKKMNATNAKALNSMKQKLKKAQREYEETLTKYKADPEAFEKAAIAADAPAPAAPKVKTPKASAAAADEEDDDFQTVGNKGKTIAISSEGIYKALAQVMEARGRKNTDRTEQIKILEKLQAVAATPYQRIRVLLALISALLDYSVSTSMPLESWISARTNLDLLLDELITERAYVVREDAPDYDDQVERAPTAEEPLIVVRGSVISLVDRLDDEFTKSLQNIDPHTGEYIERLKDEKQIYETIVKAQIYLEQFNLADHLDRVVMRRLEHIYCKPDVVTLALETALPELPLSSKIWPHKAGSSDSTFSAIALVRALCVHLYKQDNSLLRTRAMLSHIYHYALHDDYYTARDMLLMSHLQDTIGGADVATQILYNRTVVQVGLCAFRLGLIRESQSTLQEIFATQRVKELLAQGVQAQRYSALTPEQDKIERQRQLPFHMHINIELLETAYLVSSMLLEVPLMAQAGNDPELKKKVISRTFRRQLEYANRQVFTGPPENKRDHVMQATKALQAGDWQKCIELIHSIKVWNLMPSEKAVKEMLAKKIQEEGLRTYLFTYAPFYSTLSLSHLASTFNLSLSTATSLVSKMIWNEELDASLDQVVGVVVLQSTELTSLQRLALALVDKASQMADNSERYISSRIDQGGEPRADGARNERTERGEGGRERRGGGGRGRGASRGRGVGRQFNNTLGRTVQA